MSRDNLRPSLVYTGNVEQYTALEQNIEVSAVSRIDVPAHTSAGWDRAMSVAGANPTPRGFVAAETV